MKQNGTCKSVAVVSGHLSYTVWKTLLTQAFSHFQILLYPENVILTNKYFKQSCLQSHGFLFSPVPQINWRRTDGLPFPSKIKLRKSNGMIEIPNFQQEDAGLYECITENSRGKNIARGRLTYYGRKLSFPLSPTFLYTWNINHSRYLEVYSFCSTLKDLCLRVCGILTAHREWELLHQVPLVINAWAQKGCLVWEVPVLIFLWWKGFFFNMSDWSIGETLGFHSIEFICRII